MLAIFEAFYCPFTVNLSGKMASRLAPSGLLSRGATVRLMAVPQCPAGWNRRHFIKKKSLWFSALRAFFSAVKLHTLFKMIRSHENVPLALCHLKLFVSFGPRRVSVVRADGKGFFSLVGSFYRFTTPPLLILTCLYVQVWVVKAATAVFTQLLHSHRLKVKVSPLQNSFYTVWSTKLEGVQTRLAFLDFTENLKQFCNWNIQKEKIKY